MHQKLLYCVLTTAWKFYRIEITQPLRVKPGPRITWISYNSSRLQIVGWTENSLTNNRDLQLSLRCLCQKMLSWVKSELQIVMVSEMQYIMNREMAFLENYVSVWLSRTSAFTLHSVMHQWFPSRFYQILWNESQQYLKQYQVIISCSWEMKYIKYIT